MYAVFSTLQGLNTCTYGSLYQANVPLNDKDKLSFCSNKPQQAHVILLPSPWNRRKSSVANLP